MTPILTAPVSPQKRSVSAADYDIHPSKKQRQLYHRHHTLRFKQQSLPDTEVVLFAQLPLEDKAQDANSEPGPKAAGRSEIDDFLSHSIVSVCQDVAKKERIKNSSIDTWALETFRGCVEEYILNLCQYIRRPMLAARRTAPIASDFESAFQAVQVPTPEDQLPPRLKPKPPSPLTSLPTPPLDDFFHAHELPDSLLGSAPTATTEEKKRNPYIPSTFPAFPSQHTFKATSVPPPREKDPRKIRELATEEGRLGEQALRKLAGAARGEGKLDLAVEAVELPATSHLGKEQKVTSMEEMFKQTMTELMKRSSGGASGEDSNEGAFEMAPIVNSERKYWMPNNSRRKAPRTDPTRSLAEPGNHHHGVSENSEKVRGKHKAKDTSDGPKDDDLVMAFS